MKELVQRLYSHKNYEKLLEWCKLITITGLAQVLIQGIGLVSGIIIIRILSTQEYAHYTLANTMLGTMTVLADAGIGAGVMSQGGKVWQNPTKLGGVLVTGMELRKVFSIGSLIVSLPLLLILLRQHGADWLMAGLIVLSLLPVFIMLLSTSLLEIAAKLHQDIASLQKVQVVFNVTRLLILSLTLILFPWSFVVFISIGLSQIWANKRLRKISETYADWDQSPDPAVQKNILANVKRLLPDSIYYCFSGQITIWLISIFGSTSAVAQVGGLGRLVIVLNLFGIPFTSIILPRFARMPNNSDLILNRYLRIQFGLLIFCTSLVGTFWLFSSEILGILGREYLTLADEMVLLMIGSSITYIVGTSFHLCNSRGWIISPIISIPVSLVSMALGVLIFNVSNLKGLFSFNIFIAIVQLLMHVSYMLLMINKNRVTY